MRVRIYQPSRSAMQSGRGSSSDWVMECPRHDRATPDLLMGWQSSSDTTRTVRLSFPTKEEAILYAERYGFDYQVIKSGSRRVERRSYADNFASNRRGSWTH